MNLKQWSVVSLVFLMAQVAMAAVHTVSQDGRGAYTSIQAAINAAGKNDEVVVLDYAVYEEQVTIDSSKSGLTLRSENPRSSRKPTIKWQDKVNVLPSTCEEAKVSATINFDQNGALRIMRVRGVVIDGIAVDGGGIHPYGWKGVWDGDQPCQYSLQSGNIGLNLWIAGDAIVRNCDISNAYIGINFKDRNEGGIYANANPADIAKWLVVPLSGFGKTGNHLIEYNRVHNNSFGMFFESTWDLGSVIRYNLIYSNFHQTSALATQVKGLTPDEGPNQTGGAMLFKDHMLSPLAIYNNTFWNNFLIFVGGWRAGSQHLIFNNIYAKPHRYWGDDPNFQNPFHVLDPAFVYRTFHSVYATQCEAPKAQVTEVQEYDQGIQAMVKDTIFQYQARIMNGMDGLETVDVTVPLTLSTGTVMKTVTNARVEGNRIIGTAGKPFPAENNVRWLETKFKSTDPTSPDFLVPDWDDSLVNQFIVDQGWPAAGILDPDGSIADLGAISKAGGQHKTEIMIKPIDPVLIAGNTATVNFSLYSISGTINNPKIKYIRWINNVVFQADAFGGNTKPIPLSEIQTVTPPNGGAVSLGGNSLTFTVPTRNDSMRYAFFELVIEGTDAEGNTIVTDVGFLPYRQLEYKFVVEVLNASNQVINTVQAGQPVKLRIIPQKIGDTTPLTATIDPVEVNLTSGFDLLTPDGQKYAIPGGITLTHTGDVMFTKVPEPGKTDIVSVAGKFQNPGQDIVFPIFGSSVPITILPGPPAKVEFQDPPSNGVAIVDPGQVYTVKVQVYDEYDNKTGQTATVSLASGAPLIGDVVGLPTDESDSTGLAVFQIGVTEGDVNDTFPLVATLMSNGFTDNAKGVVGKARDRLSVYFSDTLGVDPTVVIDECAGDRVPVTIRATTTGDTILTDKTTTFDIELSPGLAAFATPSETDVARLTQATLVNGQVKIYVQSTINSVSQGMITVYPTDDNSVLSGSRSGISFHFCDVEIASAAYFADNGDGQVNRLELYYKDSIETAEIPDSIELYWPAKDSTTKRMVSARYSITHDPANKRHLTVILPEPFPANITTYSFGASGLGTTYWKNAALPDAPVQVRRFAIADSVGPLLQSATLIERVSADGEDTLLITFTESVPFQLVEGVTLRLIKHAGADTIPLTILDAIPLGDTIRIAVQNAGLSSPKGGDLLQIISSGTIADVFGNKAHPQNRPVVISIRAVPPSIVSAFYEDSDANGVVDRVTIKYDKKVDIATMGVTCVWSMINNRTSNVSVANFSYGLDSTTVIVSNIHNHFADKNSIVDRTSGNMDLITTFTEFPNEVKGAATDKAGAVLTSATYYPGSAETVPDTFIVTFSENVSSASFIAEPYQFYYGQGQTYILTLANLQALSGSKFTYLVSLPAGTRFPMNGDSVNMLTTNPLIYDGANNFQEIATNKKVPLKVMNVPYTLEVKAGPNPFNLSLFESVTIQVVPVAKMVENVQIEASIAIYDQLGNKVYEDKSTDLHKSAVTPGAIDFKWTGTNKNGRRVGSGTYVARLTTKNLSNDEIRKEKVYIGITR